MFSLILLDLELNIHRNLQVYDRLEQEQVCHNITIETTY